jgi:UDP-N-acetylglucosamine 2-epimerase (non-hydrolysing)
MKTIMTVTGIRPDFIRMSEIFRRMDQRFNHILVHTGQHFDALLSDVFFAELKIREPDYNLQIGSRGKRHHEQLADLSVKVIELIEKNNLHPDIVVFLGDSNSVLASVSLKKEGFKIGHIEAGMRSFDRKMLEETNRVVCDHCSDFLFVYHDDYKDNCLREGISLDRVHVVGNTIVEVCRPLAEELKRRPKRNADILVDIHRPENFNFKDRITNILEFVRLASLKFNKKARLLGFGRTLSKIQDYGLDLSNIEVSELLSYRQFVNAQYDALFMISDSGTAQDEPALIDTPVLVPRDFTERPQSMKHGCSRMVDVMLPDSWAADLEWVEGVIGTKLDADWLGDGSTSERVVSILSEQL